MEGNAGGGTTDYAVEIFHKAVASEKYTCFVNRQTRLPMMYMDDAIKATLQLMDAPSDALSIRGVNLPSLNFTAEELYNKIRERIPDFECDFSLTIAKNMLIRGLTKPMVP